MTCTPMFSPVVETRARMLGPAPSVKIMPARAMHSTECNVDRLDMTCTPMFSPVTVPWPGFPASGWRYVSRQEATCTVQLLAFLFVSSFLHLTTPASTARDFFFRRETPPACTWINE